MAYLDPKLTKKVREELKNRYPDFKFSVRTANNSTMVVVIREAPYNLLDDDNDSGYESVNQFHIDKFYEDEPRKKKLLNEITDIMEAKKEIVRFNYDYGSIPNYYTRLKIGEWDRPFKVVN